MKRNNTAAVPIVDYGAQPWRIVKEDAPDPDSPNSTIRRARVTDPVLDMERRGIIDRAHVNAAARFRDCMEIADGARQGVGNVRLEAWQRCHYSPRVADARQEVVACIQAVGLRLGEPFRLAVMGELKPCGRRRYVPLREIDRRIRRRSGAAEDLVAEALERLRCWQSNVTVDTGRDKC